MNKGLDWSIGYGYRPEVQAQPASVRKKFSRQGAKAQKTPHTQEQNDCFLCAFAALREKGFSCSWMGIASKCKRAPKLSKGNQFLTEAQRTRRTKNFLLCGLCVSVRDFLCAYRKRPEESMPGGDIQSRR